MKVVMVGDYPLREIFGGVAKHMKQLTYYLSQIENMELYVITFNKKNKQFKRNGINIYTIRVKEPSHIINILFSIPILYHFISKIKEIEPDIVHFQGLYYPYSLCAAFVPSKYPVLLTLHGIKERRFKRKRAYIFGIFYLMLKKYSILKIKNIIAVTPYEKAYLQQYTNSRIYVIPNGVEDKYFRVKSSCVTNKLLFVGGITQRKGLLDLINAMKKVVNKISTANLDIIGAPISKWYYVAVKRQIRLNKLTRNIKLLGYLNDDELIRKYQETSIFVLPSYEESQGIVLLEAMACGKPVVASNVGGIPYVVENGKTGLLFKCGNIKELAEKIIILLQNKEMREKMGEEGRKNAKEFSWDEIAEKTVKLYEKVLSKQNK